MPRTRHTLERTHELARHFPGGARPGRCSHDCGGKGYLGGVPHRFDALLQIRPGAGHTMQRTHELAGRKLNGTRVRTGYEPAANYARRGACLSGPGAALATSGHSTAHFDGLLRVRR